MKVISLITQNVLSSMELTAYLEAIAERMMKKLNYKSYKYE